MHSKVRKVWEPSLTFQLRKLTQVCKIWYPENSLVTKIEQSRQMMSNYKCPSPQGRTDSKMYVLCFRGLCCSNSKLGVYLDSESEWLSSFFSLSPFFSPSLLAGLPGRNFSKNHLFPPELSTHGLPLGNLISESARTKLELRIISLQTSVPNSIRHRDKMCRGG